MATTTVVIPIANGRVHSTKTPSVAPAFDTNHTKYTAVFDPTAENRLHFTWMIPGNYLSGSLTVKLIWRCTGATTGDVVWKASYSILTDGSTGVGGGTTATTTTTVPGTAGLIATTTLTFTSPAANKLVAFAIIRDATAGGDTCTASAELLDIIIEYTSDPTVTKGYIWVPANALVLPSSSTASLSGPSSTQQFSNVSSDDIEPYVLNFPDAASAIGDFKLNLPSNYLNNPKITLWVVTKSASATAFFFDAAIGAVGSARDPALTAGSSFNFTGATTTLSRDLQRTFSTVTPTTSGELCLRLKRDNSDASTVGCEVVGYQFEYDINANFPVVARVDPAGAVVPASGGAALIQANDTNLSRWVMRYTDNFDLAADFLAAVVTNWQSGGTVRIRWTSSASTGNCRWRVDWGSPASGAASDPVLTAGTAVDVATSGANVINETTFDISSGLAALDEINFRITRLGSHANDTLSADVDVLEVVFESRAGL